MLMRYLYRKNIVISTLLEMSLNGSGVGEIILLYLTPKPVHVLYKIEKYFHSKSRTNIKWISV